MKNLLLIAIAILGFSAVSFGQSSATASASATLVKPLFITRNIDMNFGTLASSSTIGTATLTTAGSVTSLGGVKVITGGVTPAAAKFTVDGPNDADINITYPTVFPIDLTLGAGPDKISITALTNTSGVKLSSTGTLEIFMGGTLSIPINSKAGLYTNSTALTVTVNYN